MALSVDLRERVVSAYSAGNISYEKVAKNFGVAICSVRRWVALLQKTGSLQKRSAPGATPLIKDSHLPNLVQLVEEKPDRSLNELCKVWEERFGVKVSKSSMDRALTRANMTLKKRHLGLKNEKLKSPNIS